MNLKPTLLLALLFVSFSSIAQSYKIGYVDVERVFSEWPKLKAANTELQEYETQLQTRLQAKVRDFQNKVNNFNTNVAGMDAMTRKDTETELQNLQTQIQQFEANTVQSVAEKNQTLLLPLQTELKNTIELVSRENGYTHVLSKNSVLLFTADSSGDLSGLVANRLGFTLSK